jgi:hypothetical protein
MLLPFLNLKNSAQMDRISLLGNGVQVSNGMSEQFGSDILVDMLNFPALIAALRISFAE